MSRFKGWSVRLSIGALAVCMATVVRGETVVDEANGFQLTLPAGFVEAPELRNAAPDIVQAFRLGDPSDDQLDLYLVIERLGGVIPGQRLDPSQLPPGFQGRLVTANWNGFEIDMFEITEPFDGGELRTYNAQVPLRKSAIQLKIFGPAARDAELQQHLQAALQGLVGASNWNSAGVPTTAAMPEPSGMPTPRKLPSLVQTDAASESQYRTVLVAVTIVVLIGGVIGFYFISKFSPPGTVMVVVAIMYATSWAINGVRVREVILVVGLLRMLAIIGGVFAFIGWLRNRGSR